MSLATHWADLVSASLLGTDRRVPPPPPPGVLSELVLEEATTDVAGVLVLQVAALTAMRRAGLLAMRPPALLVPPELDERPECSPAAADVLRRVLADWPVLEGEWLALAAAGGWRLPGELVPALLARHRAHPERRGQVEALAGALAPWLVDHVPTLAAGSRPASPDQPIALPPELEAVVGADARTIVGVVADGLRLRRYTPPSRAVLVHLVARSRPDQLTDLAARLDAIDPDTPGVGLAFHLAELATTRLTMHRLLAPSVPNPLENA